MANIIKYYKENDVTVLERGNDTICMRASFTYKDSNDTITVVNLDNQAQSWVAPSSEFKKKDGSPIGANKTEIVTYLSENTVFSTASGGSGANPTSGVIPINENGSLVDSVISQSGGNVSLNANLTLAGGGFSGTQSISMGSGTILTYDGSTADFLFGNFSFPFIRGNYYDPNTFSSRLSLSSNGSDDHVYINSTGNVGIGTTAPSTELHVVGAITVNDGNNNTKVGTNSGLNFTGINQSAFGYNAGLSSSGDNQTVVGYQAGQSNTATSQSAFGRDSGRLNTGINQSAFGRESGANNTGDNQSVLGSLAGFSNTGANQTAVGREAGRSNTGDNNSNFGYEAGYRLSDGTTVNTGSSNSVFLGSSTKALGASQTNQIVIGHDAIGSGSNSVTLGNDSIATTALKGNVGIGTTSPSTKLDVENQNFSFIRATQSGVGGLQFGASGGNGIINTTGVIDNIRVTTSNFMSFSANGGVSNQLSLTSVGNVGVGFNAFPNFEFELSSSPFSPNKIRQIGVGLLVGGGYTSYEIGHGYGGSNITSKISFEADPSISAPFYGDAMVFYTTDATIISSLGDASSERMRIDSSGNVGIGTTSPGSKLEVNSGTTNTAAQFTSTDTGTTISLTDSIGTSNIEQNSNSLLIKSDPSNTVNNSDIRLQVDGSSKLTIKSDGNVGIGTTSPSEKLEVSGSIKANGYKSSDGSVGVTGTANASNTLTIKNGIITAVN